MSRAFLRASAILLMAVTIGLAGWDAMGWLETGALDPILLGAIWYKLAPYSLGLTQAIMQRYIWPPLWDPGLMAVLTLPATPVVGLLAAILLIATRPARR